MSDYVSEYAKFKENNFKDLKMNTDLIAKELLKNYKAIIIHFDEIQELQTEHFIRESTLSVKVNESALRKYCLYSMTEAMKQMNSTIKFFLTGTDYNINKKIRTSSAVKIDDRLIPLSTPKQVLYILIYHMNLDRLIYIIGDPDEKIEKINLTI